MSITNAPNALLKAAKREFTSVMVTSPGGMAFVSRVCKKTDSKHKTESYPWVAPPPAMEALRDEVRRRKIPDTKLDVVNGVYTTRTRFSRDVLTYEGGDIALERGRQLGILAKYFPYSLLISRLTGGTVDLGFDGVPIFSNSHPPRGQEGGNQDNLLAGTGVGTTALQTDIGTGISNIGGWLAENGEPLVGENLDLGVLQIVCPLTMTNMSEAVRASLVNNTSNVRFEDFRIEIEYSARLAATDANDWYMGFVGSPIPAAILQEVGGGVKTKALDESSDLYQDQGEVEFIVEWNGEVAIGHPGLWCKFTN